MHDHPAFARDSYSHLPVLHDWLYTTSIAWTGVGAEALKRYAVVGGGAHLSGERRCSRFGARGLTTFFLVPMSAIKPAEVGL